MMDYEAHDQAVISGLEQDLAAARAEIERLTKERDEALAQVAMAYAQGWRDGNHPDAREMPANPRAAIEAYGREKVEQALDAANIYMIAQYDIAALGHPLDRQRILAGMEKLK